MCAHTKKIGVAGKYGTRTGRKIRDYIKKTHTAREESVCPTCGESVKRRSRGIWLCKNCNAEFAGGAYSVKHRRIRTSSAGEGEREFEAEPAEDKTKKQGDETAVKKKKHQHAEEEEAMTDYGKEYGAPEEGDYIKDVEVEEAGEEE